MKISPFKIKDLFTEQSVKIEEIIFKNGYTWTIGDTDIYPENMLTFRVRQENSNPTLAFIPRKNIDAFNSIDELELTYDEFLKLYDK